MQPKQYHKIRLVGMAAQIDRVVDALAPYVRVAAVGRDVFVFSSQNKLLQQLRTAFPNARPQLENSTREEFNIALEQQPRLAWARFQR